VTAKDAVRAGKRRLVSAILRPLFRRANRKLVEVGALDETVIRKVLVLRPNHRLGNQVLITPLLVELEQALPDARVDVLAGSSARQLLASFRGVCEVHAVPNHVARYPLRTIRLVRRMRKASYDLVIDCGLDSHSSRLFITWLSPKRALGIPDAQLPGPRTWESVLAEAPPHMAQLPVFLLREAFGIRSQREPHGYPQLTLRLTRAEKQTGLRLISHLAGTPDDAKPWVCLFAHATGAKCFARSWWQRFVAALQALVPDVRFVEIVPPDGPSRLGEQFPIFQTKNLRELASVLSAMLCVVSADCGVMHLASASGVTVIGLFSATSASVYRPYGNDSCAIDTRDGEPEDIAYAAARVLVFSKRRAQCGGSHASADVIVAASHRVDASGAAAATEHPGVPGDRSQAVTGSDGNPLDAALIA
jgi:ADP-heptose:LPS heptosyltransferase